MFLRGAVLKKILLIVQNPFSGIKLFDVLSSAYFVVEATSAQQTLDLVQKHNFSLILVDMERSDEAGPAICSCLKEAETTKYIPLIILSPKEQMENIVNCLQAGAEDYLIKPINNNELLARVDAHLRTRDYYSELGKKDLLMVLELTEIISVTRNLKKILRIIVEKMVEATDVSRCSIIAINNQGDLVVKASSDLPANQEISIALANYPEIEKALKTQRPVVLEGIPNNPLLSAVRDKTRHIPDNTIFVFPIIKKQHVIGTFFLRTATPMKGECAERIFKLSQIVANITGNALENAILFESLQSSRQTLEDLAIRDGLTMLFNHQYFHACCEEEFSRAQRYHLTLSCLFIDIDDFKKINDRFGHIVGDVVLKQVGGLIKNVLRKSDIAARYGGEEFALLLPNASRKGACDLAARLLAMIRNLFVQKLQGRQVTASIGVSSYQGDNMMAYEDLLRLADEAMYAAKQSGKNRICHADDLRSEEGSDGIDMTSDKQINLF